LDPINTLVPDIGIETIHVYPTRLSLDLAMLADARNDSVKHVQDDLMVFERGVNPSWEDPVTMAVNAAKPLFNTIDPNTIGLLIVATETSLDYEKPLSSWVHRYLNLPADCRHFEVKSACYGGTLAIKQSMAWLTSGMLAPDKKALVITTDQSFIGLNKPWEYVYGAGAVALIISHQPDFFVLEPDHYGFYTHESCNVLRPLPWLEIGNAEDSLYSYMDALIEANEAYCRQVGIESTRDFFDYMLYHVPFAGISFRAHKLLMYHQDDDTSKQEINEKFKQKTLASLYFPQRIGATYTGSIFVALLSLIYHTKNIQSQQRIGIFSYGAGHCAEFYSGHIGIHAQKIAQATKLTDQLDQRYKLSLQEYELLENNRVKMAKEANFKPDLEMLAHCYEKMYQGKEYLVYQGSKKYMRQYGWS